MPRPGRLALLILRSVVTGVFLAFFLIMPAAFRGIEDATANGGDSWNYLAAGERLNAGHPLYALSVGDRDVALWPPYWTVPFVGPPLMAVVWRPLAWLPSDLVLRAWHLGSIAAAIVAVLWLVWKGRPWVVLALVPLLPTLGEGAWSGNVNSYLALGYIATWEAVKRDRVGVAGLFTGFAAVAKLTPILVAWWVVVRTGRRGAAWVAAALAVALTLSVVGAGLPDHVDWVRTVAVGDGVMPFPWSVGGFLAGAGAPRVVVSTVPIVISLATVGAVVAFRRRPAVGFAVAVIGCVAASPAITPSWVPLLVTALAPWADRPIRRPTFPYSRLVAQ